jgi:hypothetical protein
VSDSRFRWLLVLYVIVTLGAIGAIFVPGGYSQQLADAFSQEPELLLFNNEWLTLAVALSLLAAMITGLIGLYFFKRWGRSVSLYSTILGLIMYLFSGPEIYSALESVLFEVSSLLWGAILALAYYSPVASRLGSKNSFKPNQLRGLD